MIELLVVIGILGAIAAVVVPNVGSFIGRGKTEAQATELHNIQTSVMAILVDSTSGQLDDTAGCVNVDPAAAIATDDMSSVKTAGEPQFVLSDYLTGLDDTLVKSDCIYKFGTDGTVIQVLP